MEKLFKNIVKAFLVPINFLVYLVIILYAIGYWTGNADSSGVLVFLTVSIVANLLAGIIMTLVDKNEVKKFDNFYIYGNSERGRKR